MSIVAVLVITDARNQFELTILELITYEESRRVDPLISSSRYRYKSRFFFDVLDLFFLRDPPIGPRQINKNQKKKTSVESSLTLP